MADQHAKSFADVKRRTLPIMVLGIALVVGAVGMLVYRECQSYAAGAASARVLARIKELAPDTYDPTAYYGRMNPDDTAMPAVVVDGRDYVGSLAIPKLGLNLPVASQSTDDTLRISPGCYQGSYKAHDLVVCGEGYATHFGHLGSLGIRDEVRLATVDGRVYRYMVSNIESDRLEDIDAILHDWDLTLFTFNADGTCLVVRCVRTDV